MTFFAFGVNHETAPVRVREQLAMTESSVRDIYRELDGSPFEGVIVSTCNRTEIYLYGTQGDVGLVQQTIAEQLGIEWPSGFDFLVSDEDAVRHVLQVSAGLKSLVLGDGQIFAQVKAAYRLAVEEDAVGPSVHRLMHTAFRTAKIVTSETQLTSGNASVAGASVAVARSFFQRHYGSGLEGRSVLVLGAGQIGALALEALEKAKPARLVIANRTRERADKLARRCCVKVGNWQDRVRLAQEADFIVVATGADDYVLAASELAPREAPCLIVDISVPRNVAPDIQLVGGYEVVDLDSLNDLLVQAEELRRGAVPEAEAICEEQLQEFVAWVFHHQAMQPAVRAVAATFDEIRRQEIARHAHRFTGADTDSLDRLTRSIMQKLLAIPIVRLKATDQDSIDFRKGVELLSYLFSRPGCDDTQLEYPPDAERDALLNQLLSLDLSLAGELGRDHPDNL
ncbi:MAG: glutamyl-tRNA reductase [Bacteroidota bacterium]